jgi:site-specific recombinase XerD
MFKPALLGPWVKRFLLDLIAERNLSRNTQQNYRDTLALPAPGRRRRSIAARSLICQSTFSVASSIISNRTADASFVHAISGLPRSTH